MPGRDGTGPVGIGAMSGRGLGICNAANSANPVGGLGLGLGYGRGRGFGRNLNATTGKTQKELLQEQKAIIENRLDLINKQLGNL